MDQKQEVKRGEEAERLLEHPLLVEAFAKVRDGITDTMNRSAFGDEKTHHHLVIALQILNQVHNGIKEVATTGKLARMQLEKGVVSRIRGAAGF